MKKTLISNMKGATAVEFAIVLPVLILVIFGIIEFSVILYNKATITIASREGARAGIVYLWEELLEKEGITKTDTIEDKIDRAVKRYLGEGNERLISFGKISNGGENPSVDWDYGGHSGAALTVTVEHSHNYLVLPISELNQAARAVMRIE